MLISSTYLVRDYRWGARLPVALRCARSLLGNMLYIGVTYSRPRVQPSGRYLTEARMMHKYEETMANVCRQGQPVGKRTAGTRGLTARKIGASITSLSTCPLRHSFRLAVGWRFVHDHPLSFRAPIHHRLRSWVGSAFYRYAGHGGVNW